MPEPTEHHRDERVVAGPVSTLFSCAYIAACNQGEITFLQIADGQQVGTQMALYRLITPVYQEENQSCARASRLLSRVGIPVSHPEEAPQRRAVIYNFHHQDVHLRQHAPA